ncbi:MAG: hypothetical protein EBU07_18060, partial [Betaproteobacteria bacterium]|nr:hypothetical protein [Betaproteobacteria bacterium]
CAAGQTTEVEAARYALLRRLGPALRHDLVVHLQAVAMMAEVLSARLGRGAQPDDLPQALARMHRLARDAVAGALQVASWLAPPEDDTVDLRQGLEECLGLVRSCLGFRGIRLLAELPDARLPVSRDQLRCLLLSALLHLSDQGSPGSALHVQVQPEPDGVLLQLTLEACDSSATPATPATIRPDDGAGAQAQGGGTWHVLAPGEDADYRPLRWSDVRILAAGLPLLRHCNPTRIALRLPRAEARAPLQVAPR